LIRLLFGGLPSSIHVERWQRPQIRLHRTLEEELVPATAVFSLVFVSQRLASQLPLIGYGLTLAGTFSLFCYMLELQNLGQTMIDDPKR